MTRPLYFIDTEFIPQTLDLISIGIVTPDGREYYAQNAECDRAQADPWVQQHVIAQLHPSEDWRSLYDLRSELVAFCDPTEEPMFWADCGAFDFVIISRLFGDFSQWPKGWPYYFGDLQQWADSIGADLPEQSDHQHHALWDARHNRRCYEYLAECDPASLGRLV